MHINIQGRHLPITPALNEYVKEKIKKIKYYFDHIVHAHVVLEVIKKEQIAEATITIERHHFHNKVTSDDMYKSIDYLFDKIETQVRRFKEYLEDAKTHRDKGAFDEKNLDDISSAADNHNVKVHDRLVEDRPMSDLEAVLQLGVDPGARCIAYYRNEKTNDPTFAVRGSDDNYNIIAFDGHWERRVAELDKKKELQVNTVENIKIITEAIEDAVDFLNQNEADDRFFRSVRTGTVMYLYKMGQNEFGLVRQRV